MIADKGSNRFVNEAAYSLDDFQAAKADWSARLLKGARAPLARAFSAATAVEPNQNVVGVGIGEKLVDGKHTGMRSILFFVAVKYPSSQLGGKGMQRLPGTINGLATDVIEAGIFRRRGKARRSGAARKKAAAAATAADAAPLPNPRSRIRPAQPGCSIGFQDPRGQFVMAGTFGALVEDAGGHYILSNNHVLADEDKLAVGSAIFQPGLLDGGNPASDQIAQLTKAIPLQIGAPNKVDCATAKVLNDSLATKEILYIGAPSGAGDAQIDMIVHKFGRTTSYTVGRVTSIDTDVTVNYDAGQLVFQGQVVVEGLNGQPFSDAGDSGSLIVERGSGLAVALLFAGSPTHTLANHLPDVLAALGVSLA